MIMALADLRHHALRKILMTMTEPCHVQSKIFMTTHSSNYLSVNEPNTSSDNASAQSVSCFTRTGVQTRLCI